MQNKRDFQTISHGIKPKNEAFFQSAINEMPRDYRERNEAIATLLYALTYPLQAASIAAGSYLCWELGMAMWHLNDTFSAALFCLCIGAYCLVETLRRWLSNETGHYYWTTYNPVSEQGAWLQKPVIALSIISALLVGTGTWGAVRYSQNNAPQQQTLDVQKTASPLLHSAQGEKDKIALLDKQIAHLQNSKSQELRDHKSYAVWDGREYLLPETKARHEGYDKQIAAMQAQRQKHIDLLQTYETRLEKKEKETQAQNRDIEKENMSMRQGYGFVVGAIWLCFELFLLYCLAYKWLYKVGAKRYGYQVFMTESEQPTPIPQPTPSPTPIQQAKSPTKKNPKKLLMAAAQMKKTTQPNSQINQPISRQKGAGGRPQISDEVWQDVADELRRMSQTGTTQASIARKHGIAPSTVTYIKKMEGI